MVDFSKKHNIDGLTVYSKPGTKVPGLTPVKTSREEVEKETVNVEEINRRLQKASPGYQRPPIGGGARPAGRGVPEPAVLAVFCSGRLRAGGGSSPGLPR